MRRLTAYQHRCLDWLRWNGGLTIPLINGPNLLGWSSEWPRRSTLAILVRDGWLDTKIDGGWCAYTVANVENNKEST